MYIRVRGYFFMSILTSRFCAAAGPPFQSGSCPARVQFAYWAFFGRRLRGLPPGYRASLRALRLARGDGLSNI